MKTGIIDLTDQTVEMTKRINEIALSYRGSYIEFVDGLSE